MITLYILSHENENLCCFSWICVKCFMNNFMNYKINIFDIGIGNMV